MNYYDKLNWDFMLLEYGEGRKSQFKIDEYHKILSKEFPSFLSEYISTPSMQRLKGIGLLCGTDWTSLYKNRFYYSRLNHSVGVSLIVWNFTHDKKQTLAGLFHDISTPLFSHVAEFRKGDALTQTDSENETKNLICNDKILCTLLKRDNILVEEVCDYHIYPVADNERPQLSADRLEYMFPSGAALQGSWTLEEIKDIYSDIKVLKNETNVDELGFCSLEKAEKYCEKFCETGHVLQLNENKLTLQLLAEIITLAIDLNIINEEDCYALSETCAMKRFDDFCAKENVNKNKKVQKFISFYKTFCTMKTVIHTQMPLENHFCVSLDVKQRYIDPLVYVNSVKKSRRLSEVSEKSSKIINDFLNYRDSTFGCVEIK